MSESVRDRVAQRRAKIDENERKRRLARRQEREKERKRCQRRNYIIGEMVTKYFPEVARFEPGTKDENVTTFAPLEAFLAALSCEQELMTNLKDKATDKLSQ